MPTIERYIECTSCGGTGVYQGMAEREGAAVVCRRCDGTGCSHYSFSYSEFTGRKKKDGVDRVYISSMGYVIGPGKINFAGEVGEIDMDKEGVSYEDFLNGEMPKHIKRLGCPRAAEQSACRKIKGFLARCDDLNGEYFFNISKCKNQPNKLQCWDYFETHKEASNGTEI